jgi:ribosomal protein S9
VFLQQGKGLVKVNGQPLSLVQPEILRFKVRTRSINFRTANANVDSQRISSNNGNGRKQQRD